MTKFTFFEADNVHIHTIIECATPCNKRGKFYAFVQDFFDLVISGELGSNVIIEKM